MSCPRDWCPDKASGKPCRGPCAEPKLYLGPKTAKAFIALGVRQEQIVIVKPIPTTGTFYR